MPRNYRRDPKPESFWRDLIARWKTSGQTVAAFCATHRVGHGDNLKSQEKRRRRMFPVESLR